MVHFVGIHLQAKNLTLPGTICIMRLRQGFEDDDWRTFLGIKRVGARCRFSRGSAASEA